MHSLTSGYAVCGSFCTISDSLKQIPVLKEKGFNIIPILSNTAFTTDNRFNKAEDLLKEIDRLRLILSSDANILAVIKEELLEIKGKYGDERRTSIDMTAIEINASYPFSCFSLFLTIK